MWDVPAADHDWMDSANCVGMRVNEFYPPPGTQVSPMVRRICAECPVQAECLSAALSFERHEISAMHGYRGGLTARARRQVLDQVLQAEAG